MDAEGTVMFLHVAVVILTFMVAGVLHVALLDMRRTDRSSDLAVWAGLVRRLEPLMPVGGLLILGTGGWLVELSDGEFSWSQGWVVTSTVALLAVEGAAAAWLRPRTRALTAAVSTAGDGLVPVDVRRLILDPVLWYVSHLATVTFFGVVFLMAAKPAGTWTPTAILIASAALGLLSAAPFVLGGPGATRSSRHRRAWGGRSHRSRQATTS